MKIKLVNKIDKKFTIIYVIDNQKQLSEIGISKDQIDYVNKIISESKNNFVEIKSLQKSDFILLADNSKEKHLQSETFRKNGLKILETVSSYKETKVSILDKSDNTFVKPLVEGITLGSYRFLKYFKDKKPSTLETVNIISENINENDVTNLDAIVKGVFCARDIVNEPLSYMTAKQLSKEIVKIGKECGYNTEVFDKKRIEALKMGGLLAVNRGSIDPPTFSILSWEPENAINKKPYILVGKGLVYDTGGINLKPGSGLDTMKSDKAGAAAVVGAMAAISKAKLPIKVIGLIPATDNRPGSNAYVPQDIIKMFDGTTVEVMNTDAEGRMILADALSYAKKYKPELVIDLATLTGAAVVAIGTFASAVMGNHKSSIEKLHKSGFETYERLVELPLWDEYREQLKSDFADIKNIGGRWAGSITAGKFLEHFTDYKWVHLDIAGPSYNESKTSYHGTGGSGVGVRLLFIFFENIIKTNK